MGHKGPVYKAYMHRDLKGWNPMLINQPINQFSWHHNVTFNKITQLPCHQRPDFSASSEDETLGSCSSRLAEFPEHDTMP